MVSRLTCGWKPLGNLVPAHRAPGRARRLRDTVGRLSPQRGSIAGQGKAPVRALDGHPRPLPSPAAAPSRAAEPPRQEPDLVVPSQTPRQRGVLWFARSEEHTSELQSRFDLVCRLLLAKKKQRK